MTLQQIKQAILNGLTVHWGNHAYTVVRCGNSLKAKHICGNGGFFIESLEGELIGKPEDFYIRAAEV